MAIDRERKVDVNKLSVEQADSLSIQIGEKIKQITEKAVAEANSFLNIYGIACQMQIVIKSVDSLEVPIVQPEVPIIQPKLAKSDKKPRKPRVSRKSKSNL